MKVIRDLCHCSRHYNLPSPHSIGLLVWYSQGTRVAYENKVTSLYSYTAFYRIVHFGTNDGTKYSVTLSMAAVPVLLHPENRAQARTQIWSPDRKWRHSTWSGPKTSPGRICIGLAGGPLSWLFQASVSPSSTRGAPSFCKIMRSNQLQLPALGSLVQP